MSRVRIDLQAQIDKALEFESNEFTIPSTIIECKGLLRETRQRQIKEVVSQSYAQRDKERQQTMRELEASNCPKDKKQATILRNLRKAEDTKQLFKKWNISERQKGREELLE